MTPLCSLRYKNIAPLKTPGSQIATRGFLLNLFDKAQERFLAFRRALVDAGVFENLCKHKAGLLLHNLHRVIFGNGVVFGKRFCPVGVGGGQLVGAQVAAVRQLFRHRRQLRLQAGGQYGQAHDLDQADILLLDVVQLGMRVIEPQRMLLGGEVVAQHQVQLIALAAAAGNRGDGVVRLPIGLGKNHCFPVCIAAPGGQDAVGKIDQPLRVFPIQADDRHRPLDDARLDVVKAGKADRRLHRGLLHREGVVAALEVVVGQNRAADNRQVGVGADKVVRKLPHKVEQLAKAGAVDLHRDVLAVEADTVFVVVDIGRILQEPRRAVDGDRHDAVVLAGRVVDPSGIAFILRAQLAAGIVGGGQVAGGGNRLRVLFRLGQVDGDVQLAVFGHRLPLHVAGDAVAADVVGVLAKPVVPVGGLLRALPVESVEFFDHLRRPRRQHTHQPGIKQVAVNDAVLFEHTALIGVVQQGVQHRRQVDLFPNGDFRQGAAVQLQHLQQGVDRPVFLLRLDELFFQRIGNQFCNRLVAVHLYSSSNPCGWLLCHAQAEATMVFRSLYCGFHPSTRMAFSEEAISWAGSPARRGATLAGIGCPVTARATSTTSLTVNPTPLPRLKTLFSPPCIR